MIKHFAKPVYVTKPFLPPINEYVHGLEEVWNNHWLTNDGPILERFTKELSGYFNTNNVCLFTNGTLALQIALQGMGITGEVITTPFTFVATTHALYWNKIRPVFVDIEPEYFTIDPEKIEAAITPWTTAILAVHVFGHPCRFDELSKIARKHKLKIIYDAAHAFGTLINNQSIGHYGDVSMFSFHATKLFHSIEGGMLIFKENLLKNTFNYLKNFGFENEIEVVMPGINAKMNEMQALMGSLILKYIDQIIEKRSKITECYSYFLKNIPGIYMNKKLSENIRYNHAYMPVTINNKEFGIDRDSLYEKLKSYNVFSRRYFYPLICDFSCYKNVPITAPLDRARKIAANILTLPIYHDLSLDDVERICMIIKEIQEN